jgi:DNA-binding MarR family transcriptional regulator
MIAPIEKSDLSAQSDHLRKLSDIKQSLRERPGFLLRRCLQDASSTFASTCSEMGITLRQYDYLFVLGQIGVVTQGELSHVLDIDRSTNALVIGILEKKGLVQRWSDPNDARKKCLSLTESGRAVFERSTASANSAAATMLSPLSDREADKFLELLNKIIDGIPAATG